MNERFECKVTFGPALESLFEKIENKELSFEQYPHFKIKTSDGLDVDLIETKYYLQLLENYKKIKTDMEDAISKDKVRQKITKKMKYLMVDTCAEDSGKYTAYRDILNLLEEN